MPMGHDWTALFRAAGVDEYILIGEADDGTCGCNWKTWGNRAFYGKRYANDEENQAKHSGNFSPIPPHEKDGYQRFDMDALTKFQFSSFDLAISKSSKTVSFRK